MCLERLDIQNRPGLLPPPLLEPGLVVRRAEEADLDIALLVGHGDGAEQVDGLAPGGSAGSSHREEFGGTNEEQGVHDLGHVALRGWGRPSKLWIVIAE